MCGKNFLRRTVPFFATFLIGVFIASFFVSIGRPGSGGRRARHMQEDQQIRIENDRLREENLRLQNQLDLRTKSSDLDLSDSEIRGLMPPAPPTQMKLAAPHAVR